MSVGSIQPFQPTYTSAVTAGTTAASVALPPGGNSVLITNGASDYAFVRLGSTGVTATGSDLPVPAGGRVLLNAPDYVTAIGVLLNSGTGTVFVSRGSGTTY
ncbi:MAG TPA: hypothetical protein VFA03_06500 [Acetobacteraceae bacterium]|nr:hypothetical protein [Acetobacteraceae bacterium]